MLYGLEKIFRTVKGAEEMITNGVASEYDMPKKTNSPLLDAYKKGKYEYNNASNNYEYGYQQGREEAERDFQNSDYWNGYLAKVIADAKADAIEDAIHHLDNSKVNCHEDYVDGIDFAIGVLGSITEQLKEQK